MRRSAGKGRGPRQSWWLIALAFASQVWYTTHGKRALSGINACLGPVSGTSLAHCLASSPLPPCSSHPKAAPVRRPGGSTLDVGRSVLDRSLLRGSAATASTWWLRGGQMSSAAFSRSRVLHMTHSTQDVAADVQVDDSTDGKSGQRFLAHSVLTTPVSGGEATRHEVPCKESSKP